MKYIVKALFLMSLAMNASAESGLGTEKRKREARH